MVCIPILNTFVLMSIAKKILNYVSLRGEKPSENTQSVRPISFKDAMKQCNVKPEQIQLALKQAGFELGVLTVQMMERQNKAENEELLRKLQKAFSKENAPIVQYSSYTKNLEQELENKVRRLQYQAHREKRKAGRKKPQRKRAYQKKRREFRFTAELLDFIRSFGEIWKTTSRKQQDDQSQEYYNWVRSRSSEQEQEYKKLKRMLRHIRRGKYARVSDQRKVLRQILKRIDRKTVDEEDHVQFEIMNWNRIFKTFKFLKAHGTYRYRKGKVLGLASC